MKIVTETYTVPEMLDVAMEFLEEADETDLLVLYEYMFSCDLSEVDEFDLDYDKMFHQMGDKLAWDVAGGELVYLMDALHIARDLTLQRVYLVGEVFKFEFKCPVYD